MLDFSKLMNRTPEEKAEDARLRALADAQYLEREEALIAKRVDQSVRLQEGGFGLNAFEKGFVRDMWIKSDRCDEFGRLGGGLSSLSEKQVAVFDRLVATYLKDEAAPAETIARRVRP